MQLEVLEDFNDWTFDLKKGDVIEVDPATAARLREVSPKSFRVAKKAKPKADEETEEVKGR